ncbi:MAG: gluconate 2-dehydrogenase subunit 3 family protein [Candidatus Binatia bacterium]
MMRRRTFLAMAIGGVAVSLASGAKILGLGTRIPQYRKPRLDEKYPTGRLSPLEMSSVMALAEVLIPTQKKSEQIDAVLRSHVDNRTLADPGYFKEYRNAVALLDQTAENFGKKFFELPVSERQQVLEDILWEYRAEQTRVRQVEAIFSPARTLAFRNFVVEDIIEAFFRKLPGEAWSIVGYSHYPGVPADPRAYSRPLQISSTSTVRNHAA